MKKGWHKTIGRILLYVQDFTIRSSQRIFSSPWSPLDGGWIKQDGNLVEWMLDGVSCGPNSECRKETGYKKLERQSWVIIHLVVGKWILLFWHLIYPISPAPWAFYFKYMISLEPFMNSLESLYGAECITHSKMINNISSDNDYTMFNCTQF